MPGTLSEWAGLNNTASLSEWAGVTPQAQIDQQRLQASGALGQQMRQDKLQSVYHEESSRAPRWEGPDTDYGEAVSRFGKRLEDETLLPPEVREAHVKDFRESLPHLQQQQAYQGVLSFTKANPDRMEEIDRGMMRVIPGGGSEFLREEKEKLTEASKRFKEGKATYEDMETLATAEARSERIASSPVWKRALGTAPDVIRTIGEWEALGGLAGTVTKSLGLAEPLGAAANAVRSAGGTAKQIAAAESFAPWAARSVAGGAINTAVQTAGSIPALVEGAQGEMAKGRPLLEAIGRTVAENLLSNAIWTAAGGKTPGGSIVGLGKVLGAAEVNKELQRSIFDTGPGSTIRRIAEAKTREEAEAAAKDFAVEAIPMAGLSALHATKDHLATVGARKKLQADLRSWYDESGQGRSEDSLKGYVQGLVQKAAGVAPEPTSPEAKPTAPPETPTQPAASQEPRENTVSTGNVTSGQEDNLPALAELTPEQREFWKKYEPAFPVQSEAADRAMRKSKGLGPDPVDKLNDQLDKADTPEKLDAAMKAAEAHVEKTLPGSQEAVDAADRASSEREPERPAPLRRADIVGVPEAPATAEADAQGQNAQGGAGGSGPPGPPATPGGGTTDGRLVEPPGANVPPPAQPPADPLQKLAEEVAAYDNPEVLHAGFGGPVARLLVDKAKAQLQTTWNQIRYGWRELAGQMFPRTHDADQDSGEAMSRFVSARGYAKLAAPLYIDKVMGPDATPAERRYAGAVVTERRLRHIRDYYDAQFQAAQAAGNVNDAIKARMARDAVKTVVGQPNSPLASVADYRAALVDPKMRAIFDRWKKEMVPVMEDNFRRSQGMDDIDPIISPTQIADEPVNLKGVDPNGPATPGTIRTGGGRGNLGNVKMGRLKFAEKATGSADGYDIDLGAIIENSLAHGATTAAKAEMVRTMVEKGLAVWDAPGKQIDLNGAPAVKFTDMRPPAGTQEATRGKDTLYVDGRAIGEFRKAVAPDEPVRIPVITPLARLITGSALASTVEVAYHTKNLMTMWTKPGMSPVDFAKNAYGVMAKDPAVAERLVELARIGAMKEEGFESGTLWDSKYNPMKWAGRFLETVDRVQRLTAADAFERLKRQGRVEGSEANKRDFVNQLGNYNKRAQSRYVAILRDTGLGPFATAGTNYTVQGIRALSMNPGVKASSLGHAVGLRAEMLGRTAAFLAMIPLANYLLWKRVDGDDNTPIGAVKVGEKDGKTSYIDMASLIGLTRGMRQTGALAFLEGQRAGATEGQAGDQAVSDMVHGLLHPAFGPPVQFGYTAYTGKNSLGNQQAPLVSTATTDRGIAKAEALGKPPPGSSQAYQNFIAALKQANPLVSSYYGKPGKEEETTLERVSQAFGPYGVRTRKNPPGEPKKRR